MAIVFHQECHHGVALRSAPQPAAPQGAFNRLGVHEVSSQIISNLILRRVVVAALHAAGRLDQAIIVSTCRLFCLKSRAICFATASFVPLVGTSGGPTRGEPWPGGGVFNAACRYPAREIRDTGKHPRSGRLRPPAGSMQCFLWVLQLQPGPFLTRLDENNFSLANPVSRAYTPITIPRRSRSIRSMKIP